MSLYLCHDCYCWVEPQDARCPHCQDALDPSAPDPTPMELCDTIGDILFHLGEVRLKRKSLPNVGLVYVTENGLFFLPHHTEQVTWTSPGGNSLLWILASLMWTPLMFISLLRSEKKKQKEYEQLVPQYLTAKDSPHLARVLMENPGAFFVERRSIRQIRKLRRAWVVERYEGQNWKLLPDSRINRFQERVEDLPGEPSWQGILVLD